MEKFSEKSGYACHYVPDTQTKQLFTGESQHIYLFSVFGIDTRLQAEPSEVPIPEGTRAFFSFSKMSRPALWPTLRRIQPVPWFFPGTEAGGE